jgi:hypothetical protein
MDGIDAYGEQSSWLVVGGVDGARNKNKKYDNRLGHHPVLR